ncbi:MAG: hypothetical protein ACOC2H_09485 [Spirochaetota bacterium]
MKQIKKATIIIIFVLLILIPALYFTVKGLMRIQSEVFLTMFGQTVSADVTAHRSHENADGVFVYEVKYAFIVDDKRYTYSAPADENGHWAQIPEEQWQQAVNRQKLQVLYMPDKPELNHPLYMENSYFIRNAVLTVSSLIVSLICGIIIVINLHILPHHHSHH